MFHREAVAINGELAWMTKGRFGKRERQRAYVRTLNLSLDGARIGMKGELPFSVGAQARLQLGISFSDVKVLEVTHHGGNTFLRVSFLSPGLDFVATVEERLPVITENRAFYEGKWV